MLRSVYLATLVTLQLALIAKVAPPVAQALRVDALAGLAPEGWLALLQLIATGMAVAGAALALVFPGVALCATGGPAPCASSGCRAGPSPWPFADRAARLRGSRHYAGADDAGGAPHDRPSSRPPGSHRRSRVRHRRRAVRRAPAPERRRARRKHGARSRAALK